MGFFAPTKGSGEHWSAHSWVQGKAPETFDLYVFLDLINCCKWHNWNTFICEIPDTSFDTGRHKWATGWHSGRPVTMLKEAITHVHRDTVLFQAGNRRQTKLQGKNHHPEWVVWLQEITVKAHKAPRWQPFYHNTHNAIRAPILFIQTLALYKSLLTYLQTYTILLVIFRVNLGYVVSPWLPLPISSHPRHIPGTGQNFPISLDTTPPSPPWIITYFILLWRHLITTTPWWHRFGNRPNWGITAEKQAGQTKIYCCRWYRF